MDILGDILLAEERGIKLTFDRWAPSQKKLPTATPQEIIQKSYQESISFQSHYEQGDFFDLQSSTTFDIQNIIKELIACRSTPSKCQQWFHVLFQDLNKEVYLKSIKFNHLLHPLLECLLETFVTPGVADLFENRILMLGILIVLCSQCGGSFFYEKGEQFHRIMFEKLMHYEAAGESSHQKSRHDQESTQTLSSTENPTGKVSLLKMNLRRTVSEDMRMRERGEERKSSFTLTKNILMHPLINSQLEKIKNSSSLFCSTLAQGDINNTTAGGDEESNTITLPYFPVALSLPAVSALLYYILLHQIFNPCENGGGEHYWAESASFLSRFLMQWGSHLDSIVRLSHFLAELVARQKKYSPATDTVVRGVAPLLQTYQVLTVLFFDAISLLIKNFLTQKRRFILSSQRHGDGDTEKDSSLPFSPPYTVRYCINYLETPFATISEHNKNSTSPVCMLHLSLPSPLLMRNTFILALRTIKFFSRDPLETSDGIRLLPLLLSSSLAALSCIGNLAHVSPQWSQEICTISDFDSPATVASNSPLSPLLSLPASLLETVRAHYPEEGYIMGSILDEVMKFLQGKYQSLLNSPHLSSLSHAVSLSPLNILSAMTSKIPNEITVDTNCHCERKKIFLRRLHQITPIQNLLHQNYTPIRDCIQTVIYETRQKNTFKCEFCSLSANDLRDETDYCNAISIKNSSPSTNLRRYSSPLKHIASPMRQEDSRYAASPPPSKNDGRSSRNSSPSPRRDQSPSPIRSLRRPVISRQASRATLESGDITFASPVKRPLRDDSPSPPVSLLQDECLKKACDTVFLYTLNSPLSVLGEEQALLFPLSSPLSSVLSSPSPPTLLLSLVIHEDEEEEGETGEEGEGEEENWGIFDEREKECFIIQLFALFAKGHQEIIKQNLIIQNLMDAGEESSEGIKNILQETGVLQIKISLAATLVVQFLMHQDNSSLPPLSLHQKIKQFFTPSFIKKLHSSLSAFFVMLNAVQQNFTHHSSNDQIEKLSRLIDFLQQKFVI